MQDITVLIKQLLFNGLNEKYCTKGKTMENSSVTLHADHIKLWSKGRETVIENLQTLCTKCNIGKSDLE